MDSIASVGSRFSIGLIYLANTMPILISHKIDLKAQTYREMFHFFSRFVLVLRGVWGQGFRSDFETFL